MNTVVIAYSGIICHTEMLQREVSTIMKISDLSLLGTLWWVDPGWGPGAHQSRSLTPLVHWTGEKKYNEKLMGRDKDRERSLTNYRHQQNRLNLEREFI